MSISPRSSSARRDWGTDDSETPILHVDMDSFFASVELKENPELQGKPVVVGGLGNRGVVTSATYEARAHGVRAGQPIGQARQLVPGAVFLSGRHGLYAEYSARVMDLLGKVTPDLEPLSIDEAFLDVSGSVRRLGSPLTIGERIRREIRAQIGLPASVGIASTKSVAKIASAHAKPDGLLLIPSDRTVEFLHSLPVGALWGVGRKTGQILTSRGIDTVGDLANTELSLLSRWVGEASARHLLELAWGRDARAVGPRAREKSISTERTFSENVLDRSELDRFVLSASHQCAKRLRAASLLGWTVVLKLRSGDFKTITRSRTLSAPTDVGSVVAHAAAQLLAAEGLPRGGVRLAGVGVSGLVGTDSGVPVLLDEDPRKRVTEQTMDRARERYGPQALLPASLLRRAESLNKPQSD
ncbi:DNA polymerase IV [Actinomycetaceae bacterium MB13-C1-2]|nr:DNA polymerase IV [Actinomycetaceae bacterium MB13-C1-2]